MKMCREIIIMLEISAQYRTFVVKLKYILKILFILDFLTSCIVQYGDPNILFIHQKHLIVPRYLLQKHMNLFFLNFINK